MTDNVINEAQVSAPFRPRARILQLLGDQLIGSPRLAVLELVKNAYDADATEVQIVLDNVDADDDNATITVSDDGSGMTLQTLRDIWLTPGHDHRAEQRLRGRRSAKGRLPLGEKGLGRFAVHKLGDRIQLVTRYAGEDECYLTIDWASLGDQEYLDEANVEIQTREPEVFTGNQSGTKIVITRLRGGPWDRRQVRWLQRQVFSICSPFINRDDSFRAVLDFPQHRNWLDQAQDAEAILRLAPWKFEFTVIDGNFSWQYSYRGIAGIDSTPREEHENEARLLVQNASGESYVGAADLHGIGPIRGTLYTFDRDPAILKRLGQTTLLRQYLNDNGGIRVYRDGIRVYNYGEPGDDWLGLDVRRINTPSERISNNVVLGTIELDLATSTGLHEKTNREGFIENETYSRLQSTVLAVIARFEVERNMDKRSLRTRASKTSNGTKTDISEPLNKIRAVADANGLADQINPLVEKTLERFDRFKATMLRSNLSGMALVVVFHELEHSIKLLIRSSEGGDNASSIAEQAKTIGRLLDGFADIVRRGEVKKNSIRALIARVLALNEIRLSHHGVAITAPVLEADYDPQKIFSFGLLLGALNNIIDNSLFWLESSYQNEGRPRQIFLDYDPEFIEGPAIIIVDSGPGFKDSPEELTEPFFTRRPNGMGVGLYYVSLAMELHGGRLAFPTRDQLTTPDGFEGAAVALILDGKK